MKRQTGSTLLEIIVAMTLMGTVLVSSLLAFSRHRKQLVLADKRIEATMIADQLIDQLASRQGGLPATGRGAVVGKSDWIWQTSIVGTTVLARVPMQVVRFQVIEIDGSPTALVTVDVVKPDRRP